MWVLRKWGALCALATFGVGSPPFSISSTHTHTRTHARTRVLPVFRAGLVTPPQKASGREERVEATEVRNLIFSMAQEASWTPRSPYVTALQCG